MAEEVVTGKLREGSQFMSDSPRRNGSAVLTRATKLCTGGAPHPVQTFSSLLLLMGERNALPEFEDPTLGKSSSSLSALTETKRAARSS